MNRQEGMNELKFLYDQVHQTAERKEHLGERMPLHVEARSLNYGKDLRRIRSEYNRLSRDLREAGTVSQAELEAEGLPAEFEGMS